MSIVIIACENAPKVSEDAQRREADLDARLETKIKGLSFVFLRKIQYVPVNAPPKLILHLPISWYNTVSSTSRTRCHSICCRPEGCSVGFSTVCIKMILFGCARYCHIN